MARLAVMLPHVYATKVQLRTLKRRVKQWRAQKANELILWQITQSAVNRERAVEPESSLSIQNETTIQ